MKNLGLGFAIGVLLGLFIPRIIAQTKVNYKVGDCLSNGLYYERIVKISYRSIDYNAVYETIPTIQGRLSAPDKVLAWIVHDSYVKVDNINCL